MVNERTKEMGGDQAPGTGATEVIDDVEVRTNQVPATAGDLPADAMSPQQRLLMDKISPVELDKRVAEAEAFIGYMNKIRKLAIRATAPQDWVIMDDRPWLQETGVKKVNQVLGIRVYDVTLTAEKHTDDNGRLDLYFTATGKGELLGRQAMNVGMSSTRDPFFARRKKRDSQNKVIWDNENNRPVTYLLNLDEIDIPSVRKKAVTNLQARLQRDLCPINPTAAELKEAFGDRADQIEGFKFNTGGKGGGQKKRDSKDDSGTRDQLKANVRDLADLTNATIPDILVPITRQFSKFDNFKGWGDPDQIQPFMLDRVAKEVAARLKKLQDAGGPGAGQPAGQPAAEEPAAGPDAGPPVDHPASMVQPEDLPE